MMGPLKTKLVLKILFLAFKDLKSISYSTIFGKQNAVNLLPNVDSLDFRELFALLVAFI